MKYILITHYVHNVHGTLSTYCVQDVDCNCLMVNHTVASLFSCQSGCNRWPHTFLNSLMIDTIPTWLNIHTEELYNIFSGAQFESDSSHRGPTAQVQPARKNVFFKPCSNPCRQVRAALAPTPPPSYLEIYPDQQVLVPESLQISQLTPPSSSQLACPHLQRPPRPSPKKRKKKTQQQW